MLVWTVYLWTLLLNCLLTRPAAALLGATTMIVYTNDITPGPHTVVGDMTQPTYAGYAPIAVALTGPFADPSGKLFMHVPDTAWTLPAAQPGQTFFGFGILDGTGALVMGGKFTSPLVLPTPGATEFVGGDFELDPAQTLGVADVEP